MMRSLGWLAAAAGGALVIAGGAAIGCSASPATPAPVVTPFDGGGLTSDGSVLPPAGDSSVPGDANGTVPGDTGVRATACTAPPYVAFAATVSLFNVLGTSMPLAGATVSFSTCSGFNLTTDANGETSTQLTQGIPVSPIYHYANMQAPGMPAAIDAIGAELPASGDVSAAVTLFDTDLASAIPGFVQDASFNAATLSVTLQADPAATAPCNVVAGVVLSVTGHPEAVVSYTTPDWPAETTTSSTSSLGPQVFINGIQGANKVAVTGTLTGCAVKLVSASQTGNFQVVPGTLTMGTATIANP